MNGLFVTLEGIDGVGKSTQALRLCRRLESWGWRVLHTREPGGTSLGQAIREQFLASEGTEMDAMTEMLLMAADRSHHVRTAVRPALLRGEAVVCERYVDSSEAYQGYGGAVPLETVRHLNALATDGLLPHVTFLLDLDPSLVAGRREGEERDRVESRSDSFHRTVREGFLAIAAEHPQRIVVVDASASPDAVEASIVEGLRRRGLGERERERAR